MSHIGVELPSMSDAQLARAALISSDSTFVAQVKQLLTGPDRPVSLDLELSVPLYQFGEHQIQALRGVAPELIILDLEESPDLGLQLAQYLVELNPAQLFLATGPVLSSDQLMQAMRAGVSDYLPKPVAPEDLRAAANRCAHKLRKPGWTRSSVSRAGSCRSSAPRAAPARPRVATNFAVVLHRLTGKQDPAGGPGPGAGRDRAAPRRPAAVQLRGHGAELPPDGRRAARLVHRAAPLGRPPAVGAVPPREGRGR